MSSLKTSRFHHTLRTIFGTGNLRQLLLGNGASTNSTKTAHSLGFTLIELLVVIGVLGVLATGLLTVINPLGQLQKARDATRKSDLGEISKALEVYYQDNNAYPTQSPGGDASGLTAAGLSTSYIQTLPVDRIASQYYYYVSTGQSYQLYAALESSVDPQLCSVTNLCPNLGDAMCGSVACNYGVSSTNTTP